MKGGRAMAQTPRTLLFAATACVLTGAWSLSAGRPAPIGPAKGSDASSNATGKIQGKVNFEGTKPKLERLDLEQADPVCVAAHPEPIYEEDGAVNSDGTLPNVFLYIKDGLTKKFPPPAEPAVLDQKGCIYQPHVLGVMVGQELRVLSSDPTIHNVHFVTKENKNWNSTQTPGAAPLVHRFTKPEIMIPVSCNKHPWMDAYAGVTTNPFHTVTESDGTFSIEGLPPGTYTLAAWTATFGTREQTVTVKADEVTRADFLFRGK
jgi:plastocyanin